MSYKFLEDVAIADVAFEASGKTLKELFESAGLAVTNTMVKDLKSVKQIIEKKIAIESDNVEMLLFKFLQEIIFYKDAKMLLFNKFELNISNEKKKWKLSGKLHGEKLNMKKHELLVDVKAVSLHQYKVEETKEGWKADVILDV